MASPVETEFNPSPSEVITGFRNIASLVVVGRKIALETKDRYPFHPDIEDWATRIWSESGVDFWSVPGRQRLAISEGSKAITLALFHRSELQRKYFEHPDTAKAALVNLINVQTENEVQLKPENVNVVWGLFSFGIVLKDKDFKKVRRYQGLTGPSAAGYVTDLLQGELGIIPVIKKGKKINPTIEHEDLHVLQSKLGYMSEEYNLRQMMLEPAVLKALYAERLDKGDFERIQQFSSAVKANAENEIFLELQTNLWEKRYPSSALLDDPNFGYVSAAITAVQNAAYDSSSTLSDQGKLDSVFRVINSFNEVNYKRTLLAEYAKQAMESYKGPLDKWEWVAGLAFTLPPSTSINLVKTVMLGERHKELPQIPERYLHIDLAQAIVTHARRLVDPDSYGQGGQINESQEPQFLDLIKRMCIKRELIEDIINKFSFTETEFNKTKEKVLEYVDSSVLPNRAEVIHRKLAEELTI